MAKRSEKVAAEAGAFAAVYRAVELRSEGRCEVWTAQHLPRSEQFMGLTTANDRCPKRGVEHHHLFKPRRAHHTADQVVHICRDCHDRADWPYKRGRLVFVGRIGEMFLFALRYASEKAFR